MPAALVSFEAAYRHRNFTRAAEEMHTSQATVSRRVRELEADLGVSLFERHRHDVTPTAAGEMLAVSVRLSLNELSSTADRLRRTSTESNSLTVLVSLSLASVVMAPVVGEMQRRHPELNLRVLSSCEPIETSSEDFDIALQYGPSESSLYTVRFVAEEAVFPVCAPTFAAGLLTPITAADLARLPLLHVDYDDPTWTTWQSFLAAAGVEEVGDDLGPVFSSYQLCLDVAERGEGVALGWDRSVGPRLEAGTLVRIAGPSVPEAGMINAYLPKHAAEHPLAEELLMLLRTTLGPP